jgi:hypothetical protein
MFRHGSLRDERRRRSLLDEATTAVGDASPTTRTRRSAKDADSYAEGAHSDFHARWSDFVPRRHRWLAVTFAAGIAPIVALQVSYFFVVQSAVWDSPAIQPLDIVRPDSLAGWYSAIVAFLSAVLAVFIYSVRRFKVDDYRGRYRLWLWSGALWMVMSIDSLADLRGMVRFIAVETSGWTGPLDGALWWIAPALLLFTVCGVRMALDMRGCRTALASLLVSFAALASGLVLPRIEVPLASTAMAMVLSSCWLAGTWLLFFAHLAFARHVLLDAHGQLPVRQPKPKREKKPATADDKQKPPAKPAAVQKQRDDLTTRIDPPHGSSVRSTTSGIDLSRAPSHGGNAAKPHVVGGQSTTKVMVGATPKPASPQFVGGYDDDDGGMKSSKLSRAERKRLRKQQRAGRLDDDE